jgi:hypothetical protein
MIRTIALAACALMLVGAATAPDGDSILARARASYDAHPRPAYVVYTVWAESTISSALVDANTPSDVTNGQEPIFRRRTTTISSVNDLPVLSTTGTPAMRVWYRASDGAALVRAFDGRRAFGSMIFAKPAFNSQGAWAPPTADVFATLPQPTPNTVDSGYDVHYVGKDSGAYELKFVPKGDWAANSVRTLWVDPVSFEIRRVRRDERIYALNDHDRFRLETIDCDLAVQGGVAVIKRIRMYENFANGFVKPSSQIRFDDIAFPASLPDWYFESAEYGGHRNEAPER